MRLTCPKAASQIVASRPLWRIAQGFALRRYQYAVSNPHIRHLSSTTQWRNSERQWTTGLAQQLANAIKITGPIPLASYMRMCLTGDIGGYYTGLDDDSRDQFGLKGDFVTSPEISQVFGELVAVWFIAEWLSQGRKKDIQLIELGPGRGTLMDDVLRTIHQFKDFADNIDVIYMVEASATLREAQKNLLCGTDAAMTSSAIGHRSITKRGNIPIIWTESIKSVPHAPQKVPFVLAHEFFDALPIHAFQCVAVKEKAKDPVSQSQQEAPVEPAIGNEEVDGNSGRTTNQWRELVVSPTPPEATHASLKTPKSEQSDPVPEFQLTLADYATHHSRYLPEASPRYQTLKESPGAIIEVCPEATMYAADIAARIGGSKEHPKARPSGAALLLDYGTSDTVPINSLRGIRRHRRVNPFIEPGLVDLSADVDFTAIAESATRASQGVEVHGPVEQAAFLNVMGIRERAEMLTKKPGLSRERAEDISHSCRRLVDRGPGGMGKVYKVMAILPENDGNRRPVGFGGDV